MIPPLFCCYNGASTAANKISQQWVVPQVQPIVSNFAERCICTILTTKTSGYNGASTAAEIGGRGGTRGVRRVLRYR